MRIEVNVRGDPGIEESTNRYFEENVASILRTVVDLEEYPHHTLRFFFVVVQRDKNVKEVEPDLLDNCERCPFCSFFERSQTERVLFLYRHRESGRKRRRGRRRVQTLRAA